MPDTPEAQQLLSPERLAEIEKMLAVSEEAYLGNGINGDDVVSLIAMYKGQKLLYNETSRIANKQRNELTAFRQQVAREFWLLQDITGAVSDSELMDEISAAAARLQLDLSPAPSA